MDIDFARPLFGNEEREAVNRVMAQHWLASGPENGAFEREFAEYIGVRYALCVNSGSSANLIALASLDLAPYAQVLTSGCGFPATLSPIIHLGLTPILVDYNTATCNIDVDQVLQRMPEADALILAHTMGSPADMKRIMDCASNLDVPVVEDCCEALGASIAGIKVGAWGDAGTFSFYPSHQITALGGGGMVTFKDKRAFEMAKSLRDWGKMATWDAYGRNNTVYSTSVDGIPYFPHYTYSNIGWNFKLPEANAAFGREQLKRIDFIVAQRRYNHDYILAGISESNRKKVLPISLVDDATPSWFGVILQNVNRDRLGEALEERGVRHRPFFAGNITRHEPFHYMRKDLPAADFLMRHALFIGCYAGMTQEQLDYVVQAVNESLALC